MTDRPSNGPLSGVKVVELGIWVAAPAAGAMLADWGADVIKVESPRGDPLRMQASGALPGEPANPWFDPDNRGKRSVALDLRQQTDRDHLLALLDTADVFLTNVRAAGLTRLGITPDVLHARNPRLVYGIVSAYGLEGPDADAGGFDLGVFWAKSGIAHLLTAPGGPPPIQRMAMGDHTAGIAAAAMISAALFQRERTGHGQVVSTSLVRVAAYQIAADLNAKVMIDLNPARPDRREQTNPLWNNYTAGDGRQFWLMSPNADRNWPVLARIVGRPDWVDHAEYTTRQGREAASAALVAELDTRFATAPLATWAAAFDAETDFFWAPVRTVDEVLDDPQTAAAGTFVEVDTAVGPLRQVASPVEFHDARRGVQFAAPTVGAHTAAVVEALVARPGTWPARLDDVPASPTDG